MDFWDWVALHEARGVPYPVALRAARIMEGNPLRRWEEALHPRGGHGEFIERDAKGHPKEVRSFVGSRFPAMTPKHLHKMLTKAGFKRIGQKGSHAVFEHPDGGRRVVVPMHGSRSIPRGTLMNILSVANMAPLAAA